MSVSEFELRTTRPEDIEAIIELCGAVYPQTFSWGQQQLSSHLEVFPEGQFVVLEKATGRLIGMAASMIVDYSRFDLSSKWKEITDWGYLRTHDPEHGRTLYGVEIMVHPEFQGRGAGRLLYARREEFARSRGMANIRAGARISGYHAYAKVHTAQEYLDRVIRGELKDPNLTFQLRHGFRVIGLTPFYFHDPDSLNYAAVIEFVL